MSLQEMAIECLKQGSDVNGSDAAWAFNANTHTEDQQPTAEYGHAVLGA